MAAIDVLLVDDEEEFVTTLAERLQLRGLKTRWALSGEAALQAAAFKTPEVMILDLKMPGIDGMEVLRRMKSGHPRVQVIILTGHGAQKDEEEALRLGAFAYLGKPVDIEKLTQHIQSAYEHGIAIG